MTTGSPPLLTLERICAAFRDLGLSRGDSVLVHSACSTLGPVEGRADTILDALLEVLGPDAEALTRDHLKVRAFGPDGRVIEHLLDTSPSCSLGFGGVEYALRRHGEVRDGPLGSGRLQLMAGRPRSRNQERTSRWSVGLLHVWP